MEKTEKKVVRIFREIGGYYLCDNDLDYLDIRGRAYPNKARALEAARELWLPEGYTHATGSGTYKGRGLTKL